MNSGSFLCFVFPWNAKIGHPEPSNGLDTDQSDTSFFSDTVPSQLISINIIALNIHNMVISNKKI